MKTILVVMVALMMAAGVSHAYDGNITVDGKNTNTNTAAADAKATSDAKGGAATVYNNNNTKFLGQMPQAYPMGTLPPSIPMAAGEYGHQATEYGLEQSIFYSPQIDFAGYSHVISGINQQEHDWEEIRSHIRVDPYFTSSVPGGLPQPKRVEYVTAANYQGFSAKYKELGYNLVVLGAADITAEYSKGDLVKPEHIKLTGYELAMRNGSEVVVLVYDTTKGYFVPDGTNWFVDGILSFLGNCFRAGGGISAGFGGQNSKNTKAILPGARFVFLHLVPCPPSVAVAPPPPAPAPKICNPEAYLEIIRKAEAEIAICFLYSHNNLYWRVVAGTYCYKAYLCTGRKEYLYAAINHFEMAELNSIHGFDIREFADSRDLIAKTEYYLASAFYERDGNIDNFWIAPIAVVHEDKKKHSDKPVELSKTEKVQVLKVRATLEKYSKKLVLEEVQTN